MVDGDSSHEPLERIAGQPPRVIFRAGPSASHFSGSWQDRSVAQSPCAGVRFAYFNNSKTLQNSNVLQVILREHGFHRAELFDNDWNIFWCAGQARPKQESVMRSCGLDQQWTGWRERERAGVDG